MTRARSGRGGLLARGASRLLLCAVAAAALAGCGRIPRIIVLTDPLSAGEHLALGVAYERQGEPDLALREYDRAIRKDPKLVQARINRGNVLVLKKEFAKAREEYLRALDLEPGNAEAANNLAWAAVGAGTREDLVDAHARLEKLLADPRNRTPVVLDTLGVVRTRLGMQAAAGEAFLEAERACGPSCPAEQRREIEEHRRELQGRPGAPLVE